MPTPEALTAELMSFIHSAWRAHVVHTATAMDIIRHPLTWPWSALFLVLTPLAASARPLAIDDIYQLRTVSEPQLSPDGEWVAYTVTTSVRETDEDQSDIWLVSWDGRQSVQVTDTPKASEHRPHWSPDGRYLGFLSDRGDAKAGDQVWVLDRRGAEARQATRFNGDVSEFAWAPDSARFVFAAQAMGPAEKSDKPVPIVVDRFQIKQDEDGYLGPERSHLFLQNVSGGAATALTGGRFNEVLPAWSPDGSAIAFFTKRGEDIDTTNNWDVYLVEPRAGARPRQLTTNPGADGDPTEEWGVASARFSPDSARIAYLHGGPPELYWYGISQVGVAQSAGGAPLLPTQSLDRNTVDPRWSTDGKQLYFRIEDDRSIQLARMKLPAGRIERLTATGSSVTEFDVGRRGRVVVLSTTVDRPGELAAVESGKLRWLTHHNDGWLADVPLAPAANIGFRSPDGAEVHGLLVTPQMPRPAQGYPALLRLHGGPVSQHQHEFDFAWQYYAGQGYAVIAPNPRGSTGRGGRFQQLLIANWGYADVPDAMAAVDHVVKSGVADPQRLGVGGWSYGAILTNYVIASDQRFKAATSGAGMANMLAGYGTDHYAREWELELGLPWVNTELWLRLSYPFLHADRIRTPTLFLGGSEDWNVPVMHSEQMYQALRRLGVETRLVVYPGESHSISRPSFYADRLQRYVAWYDQFLKTP